jgi:hypothetical protein
MSIDRMRIEAVRALEREGRRWTAQEGWSAAKAAAEPRNVPAPIAVHPAGVLFPDMGTVADAIGEVKTRLLVPPSFNLGLIIPEDHYYAMVTMGFGPQKHIVRPEIPSPRHQVGIYMEGVPFPEGVYLKGIVRP